MKYALVFQPDHSFDVILANRSIVGYHPTPDWNDLTKYKGGVVTKILNHKIESYPSHQEVWDALAFHTDREKIEVPYQSTLGEALDTVLKLLELDEENEVPLTSIFSN